jgi:hypothetical protein
MKVFVSSVISGFEEYREAAAKACRTLKCQVLRAEDYGARAASPQQVCLAGVRHADVVVLILGARYGEPGASGRSPTHEEYLEAREHAELLVFVQEGVAREPRQADFVREVQEWASGRYTADFRNSTELNEAVIESLHRVEVDRATGASDESELVGRAEHLIPESRTSRDVSICLVVAGGPRQQILRPVELEREQLHKELRKEALFGDLAVLDPSQGSEVRITGDQLEIAQETDSLMVDQLGTIRVIQVPDREDDHSSWSGHVLIEEDVQAAVERGILFASWVLDRIDPRGRLSRVAPVLSMLGAGYHAWKTRAQQRKDPNRSSISMRGESVLTVRLSPPSRPRPALKTQAADLAEDFTTLLRREVKK